MDRKCIHCSEVVKATTTRCQACGGDPRVRGDLDVVDLRAGEDRERENTDLLASLVAAYSDVTPHQRPRWGENSSTPLEIELEPIRIGRDKGHVAAATDVVPAMPTTRRTRRAAERRR